MSHKKKLAECMDIIGEMYKVKFNPKDYCIAPIEKYARRFPKTKGPKKPKGSMQPGSYDLVPGLDLLGNAFDPNSTPLENSGPLLNTLNSDSVIDHLASIETVVPIVDLKNDQSQLLSEKPVV